MTHWHVAMTTLGLLQSQQNVLNKDIAKPNNMSQSRDFAISADVTPH